jgi:hypothetical protein
MKKLQHSLDEMLRADRLGLAFTINNYTPLTGPPKSYVVTFPEKQYLELHLDSLERTVDLMLESNTDAHEVFEPARLWYSNKVREVLKSAHNADREENHKGKGRLAESFGTPADIGRHVLVGYDDTVAGEVIEIRLVNVMVAYDETQLEQVERGDSLSEVRRKIDYHSGLGRLRKFVLTNSTFESITVIE